MMLPACGRQLGSDCATPRSESTLTVSHTSVSFIESMFPI